MPIIVGPYTPPVVPVTATSTDGRITATYDPAHGGVLLRADYSDANPQPYQVQFRRNGLTVRSGDPAWAPGGRALAYDYEMALGEVAEWTAIPIYRSRTAGYSTGTPSAGAALVTGDLDCELDFWIKSTPNPALSRRLRSQVPDPTVTTTGRNSLVDTPGSPNYSGSWDVGLNAAQTFTFLTYTHAERDELLTLLDSGPVLVQCLRLYGIAQFYAKSADVRQEYHVGAFDPRRVITVTFLPIERPATINSPLFLPDHSFDDVRAGYVSLDQLNAAVASWDDLAAP